MLIKIYHQEQAEDLKNKLLVDSRVLGYNGSINKITIEKVFQKLSEPMMEAYIDEDDWDEKEHTEEENRKFQTNLQLYNIINNPDYEVNELTRVQTFNNFFKTILPTYFVLTLVDYLKTSTETNERYDLHVIKEAVGDSYEMYKQYKLKSITKSVRESRETSEKMDIHIERKDNIRIENQDMDEFENMDENMDEDEDMDEFEDMDGQEIEFEEMRIRKRKYNTKKRSVKPYRSSVRKPK